MAATVLFQPPLLPSASFLTLTFCVYGPLNLHCCTLMQLLPALSEDIPLSTRPLPCRSAACAIAATHPPSCHCCLHSPSPVPTLCFPLHCRSTTCARCWSTTSRRWCRMGGPSRWWSRAPTPSASSTSCPPSSRQDDSFKTHPPAQQAGPILARQPPLPSWETTCIWPLLGQGRQPWAGVL